MRIVFAGTSDFALPSLRALASSRHEVVCVVTQPDRPQGRGRQPGPPPVKTAALELHLDVRQPLDINADDFVEHLRDLSPDAIVVVAFGQWLKRRVLELPPRGCWNLHASLLPKYRGAAPINWAIINGERETGVTVMKMDEGMDSGDILLQDKWPIDLRDEAGELSYHLSRTGAALLIRATHRIQAGVVGVTPQDESRATHAPRLTKRQGQIDWSRPSAELERFVLGMTPWPGAYTFRQGGGERASRVIIYQLRPTTDAVGPETKPGDLIGADKRGLLVRTADGVAAIESLQPAGKRLMLAGEYLRGRPLTGGGRLGPAPREDQ